MRRPFLFCLFVIGLVSWGGAQTVTLEEAIERSITESFQVRQAELQQSVSAATLQRSKLSRYPNIGIRTNGGLQFGLNVDPTTNNLVQQRTGFASISLDASVPIYQGGLVKNQIAQGAKMVAADGARLEDSRQAIALLAAQRYLEALLAQEQAKVFAKNIEQTEVELDGLRKSIAAGARAPSDIFEVESNLARQQQERTVIVNAMQLAKLQLKQLMRMPPGEELSLSPPEQVDFESITIAETDALALYQAAITREPAIRAAELDAEAAISGVAVARSGYYPTVSAFGNLDTRYSSQAQRLVFTGDSTLVNQQLFIDGQQVSFGTLQPDFFVEDIPVGDQFSDFFGQAIGLSLNIPVFNNGRTKAAVQLATVELEQSRIAVEQARQELEIDVQNALQAALAAQAEVRASSRALEAAQQAFTAAQRRAEVGAGSSFELTNAQILLEQSQTAVLRARYQYLFNAKVLDFYLGKPLTLD